MTKQVPRGSGERVKVSPDIGEQRLESLTMMMMYHDMTRDAPNPLDPIGIRVISRRVDEIHLA